MGWENVLGSPSSLMARISAVWQPFSYPYANTVSATNTPRPTHPRLILSPRSPFKLCRIRRKPVDTC